MPDKHVEFARTAEAATTERLSKWDLIAAIAADAVDAQLPISGIESCLAAKAALDTAGNEYADKTVKRLCVVAKFDYESTSDQRQVWRRYGWSIVDEVAEKGISQEAACELLGGERLSWADVRRAVSSRLGAQPAGGSSSFDERCAAWVHRANSLLMDGARLAEEAESSPRLSGQAQLALAIYQRITERHLDAEIRTLLESAEVG